MLGADELSVTIYIENTGETWFQTNDVFQDGFSDLLEKGDKIKIYEGDVVGEVDIPLIIWVRGDEFNCKVFVESNLAELAKGKVSFELVKRL